MGNYPGMSLVQLLRNESFLGQTLFTLFIYDVKSEQGDEDYSKAGSHYTREDDTKKTQLTKTNWKIHI